MMVEGIQFFVSPNF